MSPDEFLQDFSNRLNGGDLDGIVERCTYPFPIFIDRLTRVANDTAEAREILASLMSRVHAAGFVRVVPRMRSIEVPRAGRFRIWCDWYGQSPAEQHLLFRTICFHSGSHDDFLTEMIRVEYQPWPHGGVRRMHA